MSNSKLDVSQFWPLPHFLFGLSKKDSHGFYKLPYSIALLRPDRTVRGCNTYYAHFRPRIKDCTDSQL